MSFWFLALPPPYFADYDEMDKLASYINSPLDDFFPVTDKMNGSAIKINDKDYEFNINPEFIERVEKSKFYGREDEFPLYPP